MIPPLFKLIPHSRVVVVVLGWLYLFAVLAAAGLLFTMVFYVSYNGPIFSPVYS
jgi:hypothetical protein